MAIDALLELLVAALIVVASFVNDGDPLKYEPLRYFAAQLHVVQALVNTGGESWARGWWLLAITMVVDAVALGAHSAQDVSLEATRLALAGLVLALIMDTYRWRPKAAKFSRASTSTGAIACSL